MKDDKTNRSQNDTSGFSRRRFLRLSKSAAVGTAVDSSIGNSSLYSLEFVRRRQNTQDIQRVGSLRHCQGLPSSAE